MATYEVNKGETSQGITLNDNDFMSVFLGGTAIKTTVNGGMLLVNGGGIASNTVVESGTAEVMDGGSVVDMEVKDSLVLGGTATRATVYSGGTAEINGYTDRLKVALGGVANLQADGFASTTTIAQGGTMYVSGGSAVGIEVMKSGSFIQTVQGGILKSLNVNGGYAEIRGELHSTTVRSDGTARIESGAMIFDTVVSSGGKITGTINVNRGALTFVEGGILDFDISGSTSSNEALVTNYWLISGTPECTLTVSEFQECGIYQLADNVEKFEGTITVLNTANETLGTLEAGRGSLSYNYSGYTLSLNNSVLTLTVASELEANLTLATPTAYASTTEPTNGSVYVTATFDPNAAVNQYSVDGRVWYEYEPGMNGIPFTENGVAYFRSIDADGSITPSTTYRVSNIDKTPPDAPVITVENADTFDGVFVSAEFSKDSVTQEYSFEGRNWLPYEGAITVTDPDTQVFFRAFDAAGNQSYAEYKAENFPVGGDDGLEAPVAYADVLELTNQDVYVTAIFDADAAVNQYSFDGRRWEVYEEGMNGVPFSENGVVIFRSLDAAGNISPLTTFEVSNIDKIAPDAPVIVAENADTFEGVFLYAMFSEDSVVQEYSFDSKRWMSYNGAITVTESGTVVFFLAVDAAGNETYTEYQVGNISGGGNDGLDAPVVRASTTDPTNSDVYVTAIFDADAAVNQFSTDGGRTWETYADGMNGVPFAENGVVIFRSLDAAGNISPLTTYSVENIDKIAPDAPVVTSTAADTFEGVFVAATFSEDSVTQEYSFEGKRWIPYEGAITVTEYGTTLLFRAMDEAGNESIIDYKVENFSGGGDDGLDAPVVRASTIEPTNSDVYVTAIFDADAAVNQFSTDGGRTWETYADGMNGVPFAENGVVIFRSLDAAGNISPLTTYSVENIDKVAPTAPTGLNARTTENPDGSVTLTFSWTESTDNYSGVEYYLLQYAEKGSEACITVQTTDNYYDLVFTPSGPAGADGTVIGADGTVSSPVTVNVSDWTWGVHAVDGAGNLSEYSEYIGAAVGPSAPTASANITGPTKYDVTVTAAFDPTAALNQYSTNGLDWFDYTDDILFRENGTVYFRSLDDEGNCSPVTTFSVENIDRVAPDAPAVFADITEPTNGDVTVFARFSEDSVVRKYTIVGTDTWYDYTDSGIVLSSNETIIFSAEDAAGNYSEPVTFVVSNIDKVAPTAPVASMNAADAFEGVLVSAVFSDDSVRKEYSLDGRTWEAYRDAVPVREAGMAVYFRGTDAAGNVSDVTECKVESLVLGPDAPVAQASTLLPTNQDVTVIATFAPDAALNQYSTNGLDWFDYTDDIVLSENGTVYFRSLDDEGRSSAITTCIVENIDKVAPNAPYAYADNTALTNQDVTVFARFSEDSVVREFHVAGEGSDTWFPYSETPSEGAPKGGVLLAGNDTVYFRGIDEAGNVSEVTSITVSNIDKVPPAKPTVSVSAANLPAGQGINVAAAFSEDSAKQEYSLDGRTWQEYTGAITVTETGTTVYFRGTDAAGNVSEVTSCEVTSLSLGPSAPVASADITAPTNRNVTVSATFDETAAVNQYSTNGLDWFAYEDGIVFGENNVVYFRSLDAAGNVSDVTSYRIENIDKVAPEKPVPSADITEQTDGAVTVTATFSNDSVVRQYSYDGREDWTDYPESGIKFKENGYVYFRGIDAAGNVSNLAVYDVTNIVPASPEEAADDGWNDEVFHSNGYLDAAWTVNNYDLTDMHEKATEYGLSTDILFDKENSVYNQGKRNSVGGKRQINGSNKKDIDVVRLTMSEPGWVSFTIDATDAVRYTLFSVEFDGNYYRKTILFSGRTNGAGVEPIDSLRNKALYRTDGENLQYFLSIESVSKNNPVYYNVSLNVEDCTFYPAADNSDDWTDMRTNGANGKVRELGALEKHYDQAKNGFDDNIFILDWVGPGDDVDYFKFTLDHAAKLSFAITATNAATFGVYSLKEGKKSNTLNQLISSPKTLTQGAKIDEDKFETFQGYEYALTTRELTLEAGTYYLSAGTTSSSSQVKSGPGAYYTVDVTGVIYFQANNEDDWNDMKQLGPNGHVGNLGALEDRFVEGEVFDDGALVTDWVGSGDNVDYFKFTLDHAAKLRFAVTASDAASFSLSTLSGSPDKYKLSSMLKDTSLKNGAKIDEDEYVFLDGYNWALTTKDLLLEAGTYYLAVKNPNAGKDANADYVVDLGGKIFLNANNKDDGEKFRKDPSWVLDTGSIGLISDTKIGTIVDEDWVGFSDAVDYKTFIMSGAAKLNFTISATDAVKLTVYQIKSNGSKKSLSAFSKNVATITNKNPGDPDFHGTASTGSIFLNPADGSSFCICVESTNAKKGGDASYSIVLDSDGTSFLPIQKDPDGVDNSGLLIKKNGLHSGTVEIIDIEQWAKDSTFASGLKGYTGWVGYGDAVDTLGFTIPADTPINQICIRSTDEVSFTLSQVIRSGRNAYKTRKIISASKLTAYDPQDIGGYTYAFNSVALNDTSKNGKNLGAGDYIITIKSTNAAKGGNASYTVILRSEALETKNADALSMPEESAVQLGFAETCAGSASGLGMPETDSLAMTDSLSLGQSADALADVSAASALDTLNDQTAWQNITTLA